MRSADDAARDPAYCARCLSDVAPEARACHGCETPFTGAGRYDRLLGSPPQAG